MKPTGVFAGGWRPTDEGYEFVLQYLDEHVIKVEDFVVDRLRSLEDKEVWTFIYKYDPRLFVQYKPERRISALILLKDEDRMALLNIECAVYWRWG